MGKAVEPQKLEPLVEDISNSSQRNPGALVSLARLKTADGYTYMHSVAACGLMLGLARQLGLYSGKDPRCRHGRPHPRSRRGHGAARDPEQARQTHQSNFRYNRYGALSE